MKPHFVKVTPSTSHSFIIKEDDMPLKNPWHYHPEIELIYFNRGRGTRFVGDCIERLEEGDLVLIGSNLPHTCQRDRNYYEANPTDKPQSVVIQFMDDFLGSDFFKVAEFAHVQDLFNRASRGLKFTGDFSRRNGERLATIASLDGTERVLELLSILNSLARHAEYSVLSSPYFYNSYSENDAVRINKVYEYTINHFMHKIQLETIASLTNLSAAAFCRYFKSRTRKSYSRFLAEVRIGYACKLLMEDGASIADVCYRSGYNNFSNFNQQFKAIMKMTPSSYLRQHNSC